MTDNEIIKALEEELKTALTINHRFEESNGTESPDDHRFISLLSDTIKLINRLKAENKEFDEKIVIQAGVIDWQAKEINRQKAEIESLNEKERILIFQLYEEREKAIKEFAKRLKERSCVRYMNAITETAYQILKSDFDNLVKEMVGDE